MIWFTSDQHFGHANIIKYCNRPFADVDAMAEELIARHNAVVCPGDQVFHLGDFSMHPRELDKLARLKGDHYLVAGNHDACHPASAKTAAKMARMEPLYYDAGFRWVGLEDYLAMTDHPFETLKLHHLPYTGDHHDSEERYREYRPKDNGLWLLHGHVHTTWKFKDRMINVGVDQWDFTPVSLDQIKAVIRSKNA